jgi:hypothetical protein
MTRSGKRLIRYHAPVPSLVIERRPIQNRGVLALSAVTVAQNYQLVDVWRQARFAEFEHLERRSKRGDGVKSVCQRSTMPIVTPDSLVSENATKTRE